MSVFLAVAAQSVQGTVFILFGLFTATWVDEVFIRRVLLAGT